MSPRRSLSILLLTATSVAATLFVLQSRTDFGNDGIVADTTRAKPVTAGVQLAALRRERATSAAEALYRAPAGSRFTYALEGETSYAMRSPKADRSAEVRVGFRGKLVLDVVARSPHQVLCAVELAGLRLSVPHGAGSSPELAAYEAAVKEPFAVRMTDAGTILGYRFADRLDGNQRNFVRAIHAAFAFTVPQPVQRTWLATESDATGRFEARYSLLGDAGARVRVVREKLRYVALTASLGEAPEHRVTGTARAVLSHDLGWLESASVDESLSLDTQMMELSITMRFHGTLRLVANESGVATDPMSWDGGWQAAEGNEEDIGESRESEDERLRHEMRGVRLTDVLASLRGAIAAGSDDLYTRWNKLVNLLEARPELVGEIERMLNAGEAGGDLGAMLLTAAGATRHAVAQELLARARNNPRLDRDLRSAATHAMFQLAEPSPELLSGLLRDLERAPRWGSSEQEALLAAAALAPRATQPLPDGRTAVDRLLALEKVANRLGAVPAWLDALGNASSPRVVAPALRFLTHPDAQVRSAAVSALRSVESKPALDALLSAAGDAAPSVRARAVELLAKRSDPRITAKLQRIANSDPDPALRRLAGEILNRDTSRR